MYKFRKIILFIVIAFTIENVAPIQSVSATEQKDNISVVKSVETEGMIEKETTTEQIPETTIEKETTTEHIPETETEKETATKAKGNNFVQSALSPVNAITIVIDPGHCKIHANLIKMENELKDISAREKIKRGHRTNCIKGCSDTIQYFMFIL